MEKEYLVDFVNNRRENGTAVLDQVDNSGKLVKFVADEQYYVTGITTVSGIRCLVVKSDRIKENHPINEGFYIPLEQENLEYRTKE